MSTKIYNGFKFKNKDILAIRKHLMALQPEVQKITQKKIIDILAAWVIAAKHQKIPVNSEKNESLLSAARRYVEELMYKADNTQQRTGMDFKFSITIFPMQSTMLGMYFTEQPELAKLLKRQKWFVEYHYQNQSDRPKEISRSNWRKREKDWDEAVGHETPSNRGFTMDLHKPYWYFDVFHPQKLILSAVRRLGWKNAELKDIDK